MKNLLPSVILSAAKDLTVTQNSLHNNTFASITAIAQREVKEIAERKNCVIVGRNANSILGQYDSSLHVFIHADFSWRVKRLKEEKMQAYTEEKIEARIKQVDKAREKFCSYYTGRNFGNADNYDLSLSSSSLGIDRCIELILKAAE